MDDVQSMESFLSHDMGGLSISDICKVCQVILDSMDIIERDERELEEGRLNAVEEGR